MADNMREKIAEIVYDCPYRELHTWEKEVVDTLEALFTAEAAAMRDIIGRLPNVSCCAWETLEENMGYGEGELQAKIDTTLKGGKYGD